MLNEQIDVKLSTLLKYDELDSVKAFIVFYTNEGRDLCM